MRLARRARISAPAMAHIANGIPLKSPAPAVMSRPDWPDEKRRVLFVGRFDRQKGVDILLEALRELRDSTFAYLAGSPVLRDGASLNLPDNVRTTGWLSAAELTAYYETADVLVAPSRWEGFGLTAVEAMRAGLPVIATRVGGLTEVVEHGVTGLLVEPNSSAAFVNAIRSAGTEALKSMGEAGRQRFLERFTLDRMHTQLTALYQRLHAQKSAAHERAPQAASHPVRNQRVRPMHDLTQLAATGAGGVAELVQARETRRRGALVRPRRLKKTGPLDFFPLASRDRHRTRHVAQHNSHRRPPTPREPGDDFRFQLSADRCCRTPISTACPTTSTRARSSQAQTPLATTSSAARPPPPTAAGSSAVRTSR